MSTDMQIIRIWRQGENGDEQAAVRAGPTPVPGLVVNEDPQLAGTWNITHAPSGCAVAVLFRCPESALHVATQLADVCDWTMTSAQMAKARWGLAERLEAALISADAVGNIPQQRAVTDDLLTGETC